MRLPFSSFRATNALDPQLDPADVAHVAVRYEPRQRMAATILGQEDIASQCAPYPSNSQTNTYTVEMLTPA